MIDQGDIDAALQESFAAWVERLHPRARGGKFAKKTAGSAVSTPTPTSHPHAHAAVAHARASAASHHHAPVAGATPGTHLEVGTRGVYEVSDKPTALVNAPKKAALVRRKSHTKNKTSNAAATSRAQKDPDSPEGRKGRADLADAIAALEKEVGHSLISADQQRVVRGRAKTAIRKLKIGADVEAAPGVKVTRHERFYEVHGGTRQVRFHSTRTGAANDVAEREIAHLSGEAPHPAPDAVDPDFEVRDLASRKAKAKREAAQVRARAAVVARDPAGRKFHQAEKKQEQFDRVTTGAYGDIGPVGDLQDRGLEQVAQPFGGLEQEAGKGAEHVANFGKGAEHVANLGHHAQEIAGKADPGISTALKHAGHQTVQSTADILHAAGPHVGQGRTRDALAQAARAAGQVDPETVGHAVKALSHLFTSRYDEARAARVAAAERGDATEFYRARAIEEASAEKLELLVLAARAVGAPEVAADEHYQDGADAPVGADEISENRSEAHTQKVAQLVSQLERLAEAHTFRGNLHPRDRRGRFRDVLGQLTDKPTPDTPVSTLKENWAKLDRDLLPYAGHPDAPAAREIIRRQKAITKLIHHKSVRPAHTGGRADPGVGEPVHDVVVVGAGPAGLSAAIYGATEGLDTLMVDAASGPGGQAGLSSRIENVLGFPAGVTGHQYATMGLDQAQRVGADVRFGKRVTKMDVDSGGVKHLHFDDGSSVDARAVVIAGGVQFRQGRFEGAESPDVVYGDSTALKAKCHGRPAIIVGGANSAGQAAIDCASTASHVTLLIRRGKIEDKMSDYLIRQLRSDPNVTIMEGAEIEKANSIEGSLQSVTLKDGRELPASGVGLFIGSAPQTDWAGVAQDPFGYVKVGGEGKGALETSVPGVFAAGDVRAGSVHRVIMAAADGAHAIALSHPYIHPPKSVQEADFEREADAILDDTADLWLEYMDDLDRGQPFTGIEEGAVGKYTDRLHPRDRRGKFRDTPDLPKLVEKGRAARRTALVNEPESPRAKRRRERAEAEAEWGKLKPGDKFEVTSDGSSSAVKTTGYEVVKNNSDSFGPSLTVKDDHGKETSFVPSSGERPKMAGPVDGKAFEKGELVTLPNGKSASVTGASGDSVTVVSRRGRSNYEQTFRSSELKRKEATKAKPVDCGGDLDKAVKLLSEGKAIRLDQPREVTTLIDRLGKQVADAREKGGPMPDFDLCNVTVKGTNLFCHKSKGIPRAQMPQLGGVPLKGSKADKLKKDSRGEVDLNPEFRKMLEGRGVKVANETEKAEYMRATQSQLNGAKVLGIEQAILGTSGIPYDEKRLFVSRDNYILDGHHRWAAEVAADLDDDGKLGSVSMPVARVDMEIGQLLEEANRFAEDWGIPQAGVGQFAAQGKLKEAFVHPCMDCGSPALQEAINAAFDRLHPRDRLGHFRDTPDRPHVVDHMYTPAFSRTPTGPAENKRWEQGVAAATNRPTMLSVMPQDTTIGVTPFRGKADPGVGYFDSTRFKGFENKVHALAESHGVEVHEFSKTRGVWGGGGEPSAEVVLRGADHSVREVVDRLASDYDQDAWIGFKVRDGGPSRRYVSSDSVDSDRLEKLLAEDRFSKIEGATVTPRGNLEIIDMEHGDVQRTRQIVDLIQALELDVSYQDGDGILRFAGSDYTKRGSRRKLDHVTALKNGPRRRKEIVKAKTVRDAKRAVLYRTPHAKDVIARKANPSDPNSDIIVEYNDK